MVRFWMAAAGAAVACRCACGNPQPLLLAVSDPLASENACACVAGYAQRNYRALAEALAKELGRPVEVGFAGTAEKARERLGGAAHVWIGKASEVEAQLLRAEGKPGACLARLTDARGGTALQGLLVVRAEDAARRVADVAGYRVYFGPESSAEKHGAAIDLLRAFGCGVPEELETAETCTLAARLVTQSGTGPGSPAVAAFISDYAMPLLVGCEAVDKGSLRVIGRTAPVPFVAAYASASLPPAEAAAVQSALLRVSRRSRLRQALESRDGFVGPGELLRESRPVEAALPASLPERLTVRWRRTLAAQSLGGLAVSGRYLIVSDKDAAETSDVWRCFDAASGEPLWEVSYPAQGEMDYTSAPRATPVVEGESVFLLGAFGDLVCAELGSGRVKWKCRLLKKYGGKLPTWGFCGTPLVAGGRVYVQTPSPKASLVALDAASGREAWRAAGEGPCYGSLSLLHLGGRWQLVGHEAQSLNGWDPESGRKLWKVVPPQPHDFNVPTPLRVGDCLLAATENNGTRLYAFGDDGAIRQEPLLETDGLAPQIATPVVAGNRIWGQDEGRLVALELGRELRAAGVWEDAAFDEYVSLLSDGRRVLAVSKTGELFLFSALARGGDRPERRSVFDKRPASGGANEVWSQPAVWNGCLFLRSQDEVVCVSLQ